MADTHELVVPRSIPMTWPVEKKKGKHYLSDFTHWFLFQNPFAAAQIPLTPDAYCRWEWTLEKLGERRATTPELDLGIACVNCKLCCDERMICETALMVAAKLSYFYVSYDSDFFVYWDAGENQRPTKGKKIAKLHSRRNKKSWESGSKDSKG